MPDRNKVIRLLREQVVSANAAHNPIVYLAREATNSPTVMSWGKVIEPSRTFNVGSGVTVAFIDHMPGANFEHRVQYAFVNDQAETVFTVEATTPPDNLDSDFARVDLSTV